MTGVGTRAVRVGIDARECVPERRTGIARYVTMLLETWCAPDSAVHPILYGDSRTTLPSPYAARLRRLPDGPTLWWDQVTLRGALRQDAPDVFLSPYYKAPLGAPCPVVITIHDV